MEFCDTLYIAAHASQQHTDKDIVALLKQHGAKMVRGDDQGIKNSDSLNTASPQALYLEGGRLERSGDRAGAKKIYERLLAQSPESPFAVKANDRLLEIHKAEKATETMIMQEKMKLQEMINQSTINAIKKSQELLR